MAKKIYISPSDQTENRYSVGNTNEAEQCRKIAAFLVDALERCGFQAKTNYADGSDAMDARISESNAWGADLHIPIHTNAFNGTVMGTRMFCHAFGGAGHEVCKAVFEELTPITPGESDGIKEYPGLAEIRRVAAPTCYIEVGFHDNPTEAAWIIGNTAAVAEAICRGLCSYYGVAYLPPETKPNGRYDTLEDIPGYAVDTIRKLVDHGHLKGTGTGLDLSLDMIRLLVVLDRADVFG